MKESKSSATKKKKEKQKQEREMPREHTKEGARSEESQLINKVCRA